MDAFGGDGMKIALVHYRAGLMDGVSLEMEKWKKTLESMGNEVKIVAGNESSKVDIMLPFLSLESEEDDTDMIKRSLEKALRNFDIVVVENIWSIGARIPVGIAFEAFAEGSEVNFIGHHHDFWWERGKKGEVYERHLPPDLPNIKHVVINTIAQRELKSRKGIDSVVVPNVIDLEVFENLKQGLREKLDIVEGDLVFLQATRVVRRKAIELAIDLVSRVVEKSKKIVGNRLYNGKRFSGRVILALGGMVEDWDYMESLKDYAEKLGVDMRYVYPELKDEYTFWDVYTIGDFITYPSILEGWGNQLLEALAAKKPIVLFEYDVFRSDIKGSGIEYVSLGEKYTRDGWRVVVRDEILDRATDEILKIVFDKNEYHRIVEHNYRVIKGAYSLSSLQKILEKMLPRI